MVSMPVNVDTFNYDFFDCHVVKKHARVKKSGKNSKEVRGEVGEGFMDWQRVKGVKRAVV